MNAREAVDAAKRAHLRALAELREAEKSRNALTLLMAETRLRYARDDLQRARALLRAAA